MNQSALLEKVLLSGIEDYTGLWEVFFEARASNIELSDIQAMSLAKDTIRELVKQGWIKIFWSKWPPSTYEPIPEAQIGEVISNTGYWQTASSNTLFVYYCVTDEGEKAFWDLSKKPS